MRKAIKPLVATIVVAAIVVVWIVYGRFAVEGGKAPWAVINGRNDVLREALAAGVSDKEKDDALHRAVQRANTEATQMLLAAGAKPNPKTKGFCLLSMGTRFARPATIKALLEAGADPKLCDDTDELLHDFLAHNHDAAPEPVLVDVLALLVERGVDPKRDKPGKSALAFAKDKKLSQVVAYLEQGKKPTGEAANAPELARLGGKTKVEPDDLKKICLGQGNADLPAYSKEKGKLSPLYYFERRYEEYRWPGQVLPRYFTTFDDPSHTQLVACVRVVEKSVVKECRYEGAGGGTRIYDATFEMTIREAATAKELTTKTLALKAASNVCPAVKFGEDQEGIFPAYAEQLTALVRPFVGME